MPDTNEHPTPRGCTDEAVGFLQKFRPNGPWLLTCIDPDKKGLNTQTFTEEAEAAAWIEKHNGQRNIYFSVNPTTRPLSKKAEREDIAAVEYLHVDIDPRAGEDLAAERERALKLLRTPPGGVPPPTFIVFSGGGYQGFWRLSDPIPINGNLAAAEDAKRYNQQLELVFGADHCHNIDRIMRLPGTVNIPDEKKRKKGREPALATLAEADDGRVYESTAFTKAPAVQLPGGGFSAPEQVKISGNIPRLANVEALDQWKVPDRVKVIIVQGRVPGETKPRDDSRSAWLFDAVCALVRAGIPDEMVLSIITDPDYRISESVLDKGSGSERYALRQIERARAQVESPELAELNARHAVIGCDGGVTRVLTWTSDPIPGRVVAQFQTFHDIRNRYLNRQVVVATAKNGRPICRSLGHWWLEHPDRRQFEGLVFQPGGPDEIDGNLNLWRGWPVHPAPGCWDLFRAHLHDILGAGDPESADYILRWAAWAVQNPGKPAEVALVLRGGRGSGKSTFGQILLEVFGQHGMQLSSMTHFAGRFNAHLRDLCLLFADEAYAPGDKAAEGQIKRLVTEPTLVIEKKGRDIIETPNRLHLILASNEEWVVPAGHNERRFAVFDVSSARSQDHAYFAAIRAEMAAGGLAAMLYDLLQMELGAWHPRQAIPSTAALQDQKLRTMKPLDDWYFGLLQDGCLPGKRSNDDIALSQDLLDHARYTVPAMRNVSATSLGWFLKKWGCGNWSDGSCRGWRFAPLDDARRQFSQHYGVISWDHPEVTAWQALPNDWRSRYPL